MPGSGVVLGLALGLALALGPLPARGEPGDPGELARHHFQQGVALFADGDAAAALAEFQASYALRPHAAVLYNIGVAQRAVRRYAAAVSTFERYLSEAPEAGEPAERVAAVEEQVRELGAILGVVSLEVEPDGADVMVNGELAGQTPLAEPLRLPSGRHLVEVRLDGFRTHRVELDVHGGGATAHAVELERLESRARRWYERWWVWTIVGVVLAGAAAGTAAAVVLGQPTGTSIDEVVVRGRDE